MENGLPHDLPSEETASEASASEFEALLEPVLKTVYGTAFYLTRGHEDAEDLLQETAVLAFRAFDSFERSSNFKAWFLKVMHNRFLERTRTARRRPQTVSAEDDEQLDALYLYDRTREAGMHGRSQSDPAGAFLNRMDGTEIRDALASLPDEFRVVATLYFVEEQSYEQIAFIVSCPLNTVRSRLHRSRRLLQKALWELACERGLVSGAAPSSTSSSNADKPGKVKRSPGAWLLMILLPLQSSMALSLRSNMTGEHHKSSTRISYHVQNQRFGA
jgi:RNA polymerase sigma-70 factor (ECF subfamily)